MSFLKPGFRLEKIISILTGYSIPKQYIETGTYRGESALLAAQHFKRVETIELSDRWFQFTRDRLKDCPNVVCHLGDCVKVLPGILTETSGPTYFFLDAHFSGGTTALGEKEVPLMDELRLILKRDDDDIIVIDDLRLIGKKGQTGIKGNEVYPEMEFDWTEVSLSEIQLLLKENSYSTYEYMDRLYAFRGSGLQSRMIRFLFFISNYLKGKNL